MILPNKNKKKNLGQAKVFAKRPNQDFIPYVCHYDPETILTKNGELLQTIRVTGVGSNSAISEIISLRDSVRDSIAKNAEDTNFAFWFHTIRRKKDISPDGKFENFFADKINDVWIEENEWRNQYINEFYITIIIEGVDTSIANLDSFFRSFSYLTTKSLHLNHLREYHLKLSKIVKNIFHDIESYGAKILSIREWDGVLYSEPMRFFGKIVNLYEERYPLSVSDISDDLASHKIGFGDRELEVIGYKNKNFASMLSLKEYHEVSPELLDRILQLPFEFIITQSFDFCVTKKDLELFEYYNYILQVSGDESFRVMSGMAEFIEEASGKQTDYGKLQTTIMLISHTKEELEKDIKLILEKFGTLGFVVVREDIFSENCFWSQLPANFKFLCRQKVINTNKIGGFAALHSFPVGYSNGNHWGSAVTVMKTVLNTPYFFNFHDTSLGNTIVIGPKSSGKTVLINFLLIQAQRFNPRIFYFNLNSSAKCFTKILAGKYYSPSADIEGNEFLSFNPFSFNKDGKGKNFLISFFKSILTFSLHQISEEELNFISPIVDKIITKNINNFNSAIEEFNTENTQNIHNHLHSLLETKLPNVFNHDQEIDWKSKLITFDLTEFFEKKEILIPLLNCLFYKIESILDGSPMIIVLEEFCGFLDNNFFASILEEMLKRFREKNAIIIFSNSDNDEIVNSKISEIVVKNIATEIFMSNHSADENFAKLFKLEEDEQKILKVMNKKDHNFLCKSCGDSVVISLNIHHFVEMIKILSSDEITIAAMEEVMIANTDEKGVLHEQGFIMQLVNVLDEIEKVKISEEKRKEAEERERLAKEREAKQNQDL
jgi:type IV secretion system protein VirB4